MTDPKDRSTININLKKVPAWLFIMIGVLVISHIVGQIEKYVFNHSTVFGLVPFFDLGNEKNLPTFFQMMILFFASAQLLLCYRISQNLNDSKKAYWIILSIGFFYMGMDEWFVLHEKTNQFVRDLINVKFMNSVHFPWVVLGLIVVVLSTAFFYGFLKKLDKKIRRLLILAAVLYITGSIGFEMIGGLYIDMVGADNLVYALLTACEETLEMVGVVVMIKGILGYLAEETVSIVIKPQ
ncbi:MAG: hypothetical protein GYA22_00470 [Bacteroidales bacterium]|nr:hypothetical protein [Bacteroidales bacterium]